MIHWGAWTRVAGGNGVGINYTYGLRDQASLSVRYDGDTRAEQFTYSCCGEPKSWTKPDGRSVYFRLQGWAAHAYSAPGVPTLTLLIPSTMT